MHKIILIFATLLFSTGAFANSKGCDNGSLRGKFSYEVSGVNEFPLGVKMVTRSTHVVGQVTFDGSADANGLGEATFRGWGSAAGVTKSKTGSGTYMVNPANCTAEGTMQWYQDDGITPSGLTSEYVIILDQMDNSRSPNRTYHANVLATDNVPGHPEFAGSASGTLTRLIMKPNH